MLELAEGKPRAWDETNKSAVAALPLDYDKSRSINHKPTVLSETKETYRNACALTHKQVRWLVDRFLSYLLCT